jgi:hypothetical protein
MEETAARFGCYPTNSTLIIKKRNFPHRKGNSDGIGCKVIYEEGLPNKYEEMRKYLKVPKHEIFLTELIILSYPIWTGDLGSTAKN